MYCKICGTVSPESANECIKCGDLSDQQRVEPEAPIVALAMVAASNHTSAALSRRLFSRLAVILLIAILIMVVPFFFLSNRLERLRPLSTSLLEAPNIKTNGRLGDQAAPPGDQSLSAKDIGRKASARRVQLAVEEFYAGQGYYPRTLDVVSPSLGFKPDKEIYQYSTHTNDQGYVLEVVMGTSNISGTDVFTEGGQTKLRISSE